MAAPLLVSRLLIRAYLIGSFDVEEFTSRYERFYLYGPQSDGLWPEGQDGLRHVFDAITTPYLDDKEIRTVAEATARRLNCY